MSRIKRGGAGLATRAVARFSSTTPQASKVTSPSRCARENRSWAMSVKCSIEELMVSTKPGAGLVLEVDEDIPANQAAQRGHVEPRPRAIALTRWKSAPPGCAHRTWHR